MGVLHARLGWPRPPFRCRRSPKRHLTSETSAFAYCPYGIDTPDSRRSLSQISAPHEQTQESVIVPVGWDDFRSGASRACRVSTGLCASPVAPGEQWSTTQRAQAEARPSRSTEQPPRERRTLTIRVRDTSGAAIAITPWLVGRRPAPGIPRPSTTRWRTEPAPGWREVRAHSMSRLRQLRNLGRAAFEWTFHSIRRFVP